MQRTGEAVAKIRTANIRRNRPTKGPSITITLYYYCILFIKLVIKRFYKFIC